MTGLKTAPPCRSELHLLATNRVALGGLNKAQLGGVIRKVPQITHTPEIATEHEIEDEEAVLVVLEGVPQVDDERVVDLHSRNVSGTVS